MPDDRPDDDGISSDDLLKEAKSEFGLDDGSGGVAGSILESSLDDDEPAELSISEISEELSISEISEEPAEGESFAVAPHTPRDDVVDVEYGDSIRFTIPDPGVPTGLPPEPVEVDSDAILAGVPAPPEVTAKAGGILQTLWRNRWIVVVAVVGISLLASLLDRPEPIADAAPGDCFDNPSTPIDCSDSHELEVFATVLLAGDEFPGDFGVAEQAFNTCLEFFEGYVGEPYPTSIYYALAFAPSEAAWDAGDRDALCVVYEPVPGTDGEDIMARKGSLRGSGL